MSRLLRRLSSSTTTTSRTAYPPSSSSSTPNAAQIASLFLAHHAHHTGQTLTQTLDTEPLRRLAATLGRPPPASPSSAPAAVPACHHLVYFLRAPPERALGADGTDTSYSPAAPFTRRVWAGGELCWAAGAGAGGNLLRVGQRVVERTAVRGAEAKRARGGEEMVVVGVEKRLENERGWAVVDKRNWIFRPEITVPLEPAPRPARVPFPEGRYTRDLLMTPVTLFRFSALTFNAHKIHYNREWCREVEGHRDLVVHGPLNLVHMVDFWRDVFGNGDDEFVPKRVVYRATSPLYAGEPYRIVMDEERDGASEVRIVDGYGIVSMIGRIERFQGI